MLTENTPLTLQLKLQDCLIEVTRFDDDETKSALFSLNCYLTPGSSIHQGATFDCHMVSYSMFENDVRAHFNYNPDRDEIRWDNKSSFQLKSKDAGSAAKVFIVKSHNSWVTALLAMQSAHGQQASTESSSGAIPLEVSARFSIMRADCMWISSILFNGCDN